jgi:hypothetical protein
MGIIQSTFKFALVRSDVPPFEESFFNNTSFRNPATKSRQAMVIIIIRHAGDRQIHFDRLTGADHPRFPNFHIGSAPSSNNSI